eukprot:TRINITY_DN11152_c0_g1_i1.p1 TRINITY_DN11152_c0_g1~~TRINITY_DN11152_c0_g1_i1.p1  ORF type:complete len:335 (-),score=84.21 TRINITY_DN11152_c0_g1_i1:50-1054(-)
MSVAKIQKDLETYRQQFRSVQGELSQHPNHEDLSTLYHDLTQLIALTEIMLQQKLTEREERKNQMYDPFQEEKEEADENENELKEKVVETNEEKKEFVDEEEEEPQISNSSSSEEYLDDYQETEYGLPSMNQGIGDWEKYTNGIGSKLMVQMGYVRGEGLGKDHRGVPIPIGLEMIGSEKHGLGFTKKKKKRKKKKKINLPNKKSNTSSFQPHLERSSLASTNIFDILNSSLNSRASTQAEDLTSSKQKRGNQNEVDSKTLLNNQERSYLLTKKIEKLEAALKRNSQQRDQITASAIKRKIESVKEELAFLDSTRSQLQKQLRLKTLCSKLDKF